MAVRIAALALFLLVFLAGCAGLAEFFTPVASVNADGSVTLGPSPAEGLEPWFALLPPPFGEIAVAAMGGAAIYFRRRWKRQPSPEQDAKIKELEDKLKSGQ